MDDLKRIPENIKIYLQEIADRMKQGRAVVMVGSGFSKNARKCRYTGKKFLDWNQLGDIFYEKLYGKKPGDEEFPNYYQDILKLASNVEQCLGRTTLDRLLLDHLPDEEYEPSELHELLLKLNWTDIFTTNYDTLLERTRVKVFDRRYQVVLSKDDLVYSKCPRIIKLHGSFPSTRPFVLTEEDYRRYPKDSAVFVNTVQQALIENVMCMVGFSGDDPNFLNWIGWIRDNLGNSAASKIYMVGVFDVKETEQKLYESRNIVLVNMKDCAGIKAGDHEEGLKLFFRSLREMQDMGWITENYSDRAEKIRAAINVIICNFHEGNAGAERTMGAGETVRGSGNEAVKERIREIKNIWKEERECYPGWMIMPYRRREELEKSVRQENLLWRVLPGREQILEDLGGFLYEFDWRRERCMLPLEPEVAALYRSYLGEKMKPVLKDDGHRHNLSKIDMELYISLLCFFREHGDFAGWEECERWLSCYWLDEEQEMRRYCERAYLLFYNFEYSELSEKLVEWRDEIKNGETIFFHAALLCELGYFEKAVWLLKMNLDAVRGQIGENADYQNYSREAYIIVLLESIEKYFRFVASRDETKRETESYGHLRALWSYDCNPEYERDYLVSKINQKHKGERHPERLIKFMERTGSIFRNSYLFRYDEEYAEAVMEIAKTNPYLALVCTLRFDDLIACQKIWGRETLACLKVEHADQIVKTCILACRKNRRYILETMGVKTVDAENGINGDGGNRKLKFKDKSIVTVLPRLCPSIIAGVVAKASSGVKMQAVEFISFALENQELSFAALDLMVKAVAVNLTTEDLGMCLDVFMGMPLGQAVEPFWYVDMGKAQRGRAVNIQLKSIPKKGGGGEKLDSVRIRKAAYSIITGRAQEGKEAARAMRKMVEKQAEEVPRAVVKMYYFYCLMFGAENGKQDGTELQAGRTENYYLEKAKESWLAYFREQVRKFAEIGKDYCSAFKKEMEGLLSELKFFHYNNSGNYVTWNAGERKEIVELLTKWASQIGGCYGWGCKEGREYMEGWYILWEIFLEVLFHGDGEGNSEMRNAVGELESALHRIGIPFTLGSVLAREIPEFSGEFYDMLIFRLFDREKSFIEIAKMAGLYILIGKGDRFLMERFWKLILHIGEEHALEMTYLQPLADEVAEGI